VHVWIAAVLCLAQFGLATAQSRRATPARKAALPAAGLPVQARPDPARDAALFAKHGVNVVFAGHEHFYERIKPQKGICYFTSGGSAKLRRGNVDRSHITAAAFDTDHHFMFVEIAGDEMYFQTISRPGRIVDSGVIRRPERKAEPAAAGAASTGGYR
jgi:hypothetical protein